MMQYDDNAEKYGYEGEMTTLKCDELKRYEVRADYDAGTIDVPCDNEKYGNYMLAEDVIAAIAELKEAWRSEHEACEALKKKLEDMQASAYAESVDAGMRERRLRRALWVTRAQRANDKARIFYFAETCGVKLNIDGYSNREKGHARMCTARWWRLTWLKVERKCLKKVEEYK